MRFFFDTEFSDTGRVIDLISIGVVAEDGREFYAVSTEYDSSLVNDWVRENVIPKLDLESPQWIPRDQIRDELLAFVAEDEAPQFWAYNAAYDWVAVVQLFGPLTSLPRAWPRFVRDLRQWMDALGAPPLDEDASKDDAHNALVDARYNQRVYEYLKRYEEALDSSMTPRT